MTQHCIILAQAQAIIDDDPATIILCDLALGRAPAERDLARVHEQAAARFSRMNRFEALQELMA